MMKPLLQFLALTITSLYAVAAIAGMEFDLRGEGGIDYVIDGDTAFVEMKDRAVWTQLRNQALIKQKQTGRDLNIGDNFRAYGNVLSVKVRMGHIDTAESEHRDESKNTASGEAASTYAKNLFSDDPATFVCWEIGYYGRPICSVQTPDGDWGKLMIEGGYATYITKWGKHPLFHREYSNI
ncbi:thermonuclease family protein [Marinobacter salarius]|nr:thermonuclease family protein [Marinobacter salarius]